MDSWFREIYVLRAWRVYLATGFDFRETNRVCFGSVGVRVCFQSPTLPLYYEGKVKKTIFPQTFVYVIITNNCPTRLAPKIFKIYSNGSTCENDKACKANEICACTEHCGKICIDLRVRIKDHKNSPHGKFNRFIFPFSSKFSDLNFASYVLYNLPVLCHVSHTVSLGYLWSIFLVSVNVDPVLVIS